MSGRTAASPVTDESRRTVAVRQPTLAGIVLICLVALVPILGPIIVLLVSIALIATALIIRYPVVGLLVPLLVAPAAFTPVPGTGGLRVIHVAVLVAMAGVALGAVTGRIRAKPPAVLIFPALFAAAFAMTTLTSHVPVDSLRATVGQLLGLGMAVSAGVVVRQSREYLPWLLRGWIVGSVLVIVPALPGALNATDLFAGALVEGRVQGVFSQPNDFGEFSFYALVMSWALYAAAKSRGDRIVSLIGGVAAAAGVAVSFSRGTWIGLVVMMLAACVFAPRLLVPVAGAMAALAPIFVVSVITGTPPFAALSGRLTALFSGSNPNPEDDRGLIHEQAWRIFTDNPISGRGPATFPGAAYDPGADLIRRPYIHGHSVLLTVAAEMGLIGIVTLLALTIAMAVVFLRARRRLLIARRIAESSRLSILAAGLVGIAAHGLFDCVYTNPYLVPLAWFQIGILAGICAGVGDAWRRPSPDTDLENAAHPEPVEVCTPRSGQG